MIFAKFTMLGGSASGRSIWHLDAHHTYCATNERSLPKSQIKMYPTAGSSFVGSWPCERRPRRAQAAATSKQEISHFVYSTNPAARSARQASVARTVRLNAHACLVGGPISGRTDARIFLPLLCGRLPLELCARPFPLLAAAAA